MAESLPEHAFDVHAMVLLAFLRALLIPRAALALENIALRQQLAVLKRSVPRPRVRLRGCARVDPQAIPQRESSARCARVTGIPARVADRNDQFNLLVCRIGRGRDFRDAPLSA